MCEKSTMWWCWLYEFKMYYEKKTSGEIKRERNNSIDLWNKSLTSFFPSFSSFLSIHSSNACRIISYFFVVVVAAGLRMCISIAHGHVSTLGCFNIFIWHLLIGIGYVSWAIFQAHFVTACIFLSHTLKYFISLDSSSKLFIFLISLRYTTDDASCTQYTFIIIHKQQRELHSWHWLGKRWERWCLLNLKSYHTNTHSHTCGSDRVKMTT